MQDLKRSERNKSRALCILDDLTQPQKTQRPFQVSNTIRHALITRKNEFHRRLDGASRADGGKPVMLVGNIHYEIADRAAHRRAAAAAWRRTGRVRKGPFQRAPEGPDQGVWQRIFFKKSRLHAQVLPDVQEWNRDLAPPWSPRCAFGVAGHHPPGFDSRRRG